MPRSLAILALTLLFVQFARADVNVRVGIVAYEDFDAELAHYETFFRGLSEKDREVSFQLAVGSYGEVLDWVDRELVDLAVLTPGVYASVMSKDSESPSCHYLASVELPPATSPLAPELRRRDGFHDSYRSVCVVASDSSIENVDDLRRATEKGIARFVFVHPMSLSGHIAPQHALRKAEIKPNEDATRFSYSHTQSLRLIAQQPADEERVAFVWDDVDADPALTSQVRRIPFPQLDQLELPRNVVVARSGFEHETRIRELIDGAVSSRYRFTHREDWPQRFADVRNWLAEADALTAGPESLSLEEVAQSLLQYARSQPRPPRLALVLSGGGAKCSYQVGVVSAVEERLQRLRRESGEESLDIELVVGTSGGAINSVPVAMGISSSEAGREGFRETWRSLDQREIVRLPLLMRINTGVWFAILQTAVIIWLVRRYVPDLKKRGKTFAVVYTVLGAIEVCLGYFPIHPWSMLGGNHVLHHIWLWLSFGVRASAWALLTIGLAALAWEQFRSRRGRHIEIPKWLTNATLAAAIFGLPLLQVVTVLFWQETISTGAGMERSLAIKFPLLINEHLRQQGLQPLDVDTAAPYAEQLRQISDDLIERELVQRDLVITGSCLSQTSEELPSDLYFYLPADRGGEAPPFGTRGVSLAERSTALLDVVMGSGSIFPIFPGRTISGIPRSGEQIELVDGGFAHNSPVEAAVLWGATHILLVEATPRKRNERGNFVLNATSAFRHLHRQAQLLDTRSRGRVTIYSIAPEPPHVCVLDFAENLIAKSIHRGYEDVSKRKDAFLRELGEPVFHPVATAPPSASSRDSPR